MDASQTGTGPNDRATTFQPAKGGGEARSGELLLVEAYAVMWLLVLWFVFSSLRKQSRLEQRLARLEGDLERARRERKEPAGGG